MCGRLGRVQVAETDELTRHSPICPAFKTLCHVWGVEVIIKSSIAVGIWPTFWAHFSDVMVSWGSRSCSGCDWHQMTKQWPQHYLLMQFWPWGMLWICFLVQPLSSWLLCAIYPSSNHRMIRNSFLLGRMRVDDSSASTWGPFMIMAVLPALFLIKCFRNSHINISDMLMSKPVNQIKKKWQALSCYSFCSTNHWYELIYFLKMRKFMKQYTNCRNEDYV